MRDAAPVHGFGSPAQVVPAGAVTTNRWSTLSPSFTLISTLYVIASSVRTMPFVPLESPPGRSSGVNGPLPSLATFAARPTVPAGRTVDVAGSVVAVPTAPPAGVAPAGAAAVSGSVSDNAVATTARIGMRVRMGLLVRAGAGCTHCPGV